MQAVLKPQIGWAVERRCPLPSSVQEQLSWEACSASCGQRRNSLVLAEQAGDRWRLSAAQELLLPQGKTAAELPPGGLEVSSALARCCATGTTCPPCAQEASCRLYNLVVALSWILFGESVGLVAQGIPCGKAFEKG